ncbi:hypothetical protein B0H14DRAFT_2640729 [Mycena olivaceomarginata]|nr:hypothetical protein B0H14DRAFT_2640729 [Mycena olivaceomarginata]
MSGGIIGTLVSLGGAPPPCFQHIGTSTAYAEIPRLKRQTRVLLFCPYRPSPESPTDLLLGGGGTSRVARQDSVLLSRTRIKITTIVADARKGCPGWKVTTITGGYCA